MIKDVMVRLDGGAGDETRLSAANEIAETFQAQVIGLFINVLPILVPDETGITAADLLMEARTVGDKIEAQLNERLSRLGKPTELRRFDVFGNMASDIAAREARAADTFVALRPNGGPDESDDEVESVIFGSGRHVFLVPAGGGEASFRHVIVAWNGSRESARAVAEAMPYLERAARVTVLVIVEEADAEYEAVLGTEAIQHLKHHGIEAELRHVKDDEDDVGATLMHEAIRLGGDMLVLGGYGHSRLRQWLLGGVTRKLLHEAPLPLVMAH